MLYIPSTTWIRDKLLEEIDGQRTSLFSYIRDEN